MRCNGYGVRTSVREEKPMRTLQERFEEKFVKGEADSCWNWMSTKIWNGYGRLSFDGRPQLAHRVAWMFYVGDIPNGLCVLHRCDNRGCVNPSHLFLGTYADNVHDCMNKGRRVDNAGEKHGHAKLTEEQVKTIRARRSDGALGVDLAREFGVTKQTISKITNHHAWK